MKKISASLIALSMCILFVSCPSGLEPAWKNANKPIFSLNFSTPIHNSGSRALIKGDGFLYIRTVGGPVGESGNFYGPYTVPTGQTFSTTEIPAGTYSHIAIIYSATIPNPKEQISWKEQSLTFLEAMKLPDADFLQVAVPKSSYLAGFFDFDASGNIKENVAIIAETENSITLTLSPMIKEDADNTHIVDFSAAPTGSVSFASETLKRHFITLKNVPSGTFSFTTSHDEKQVEIQNPALYDLKGNLLKAWNSESQETHYKLKKDEGSKNYYFYIEYSGTITIEFLVIPSEETGPVIPAPIVPEKPIPEEPVPEKPIEEKGSRVTFSANAENIEDKELIFTVFETITSNEKPVAFGKILLDANGSGSTTLNSLETLSIFKTTAGNTYYIEGFIDLQGAYTDYDGDALRTFHGRVPLTNDLEIKTAQGARYSVAANAEGTLVISEPTLEPMEIEQWFISSTGTSEKISLTDPGLWNVKLNDRLRQLGEGEPLQVFIMDDLNVTELLTVGGAKSVTLSISSWGTKINTVTCDTPQTNMSDLITVNNGILTLSDITLFAPSEPNYLRGISIGYSGSTRTAEVHMNAGSTITGFYADNGEYSHEGGGIELGGINSSLYFDGGTITNCKASSGGAIAARGGANIYWTSGTISRNQVYQYGGGILVGKGNLAACLTNTVTGNVLTRENANDFSQEISIEGNFYVDEITNEEIPSNLHHD